MTQVKKSDLSKERKSIKGISKGKIKMRDNHRNKKKERKEEGKKQHCLMEKENTTEQLSHPD